MYLNGASIIGIVKELKHLAIVSPTGKTKWCKRTIESLLSNEKYTGNVIAYKTYNEGYPESKRLFNKGEKDKFVAIGCNPTIITEEIFKKVQEEKSTRSNIVRNDTGTERKSTHYSSKKVGKEE
jgi:hypothetical protein